MERWQHVVERVAPARDHLNFKFWKAIKTSHLSDPPNSPNLPLPLSVSRRDGHAPIMQDPGHAAPNGVHAAISPELAASPAINGVDAYSAHSPAADSPATPVSTVPAPDVKIDLDYPEQESDVRNEPVDIKHIAPYGQDMTPPSRMSRIVICL